MNESIFLLHVLVVLGFVLASLRLGKGALIALISLQGVLANLFVVKQMFFLGFSVTCSDVFAIGGILSLNLLQEYYGKEAAKQAVNISLLTLLFFAFMSQIHLLYAPTVSDTTHGAFQTIFSQSVRIVFSSIGTFYLSATGNYQYYVSGFFSDCHDWNRTQKRVQDSGRDTDSRRY